MSKYLETDIPEEFNTYCDQNNGFNYNDWYFSENDYVLKEQQKYFPDLSQHIGRYIRALVDNPHLGSEVKKGDIGKIINRDQVDFPNRKSYSCSCALSKDYLGVKYELLPEDYSPEQNIEFIPGKWYKLIDCENAYRKCSRIPVENRLPYSELIGNGSYRCETGSSIDLTRIKLLEDLSEIQEYLPDGHPDKIGSFNFEVGKWYKFLNGSFKFGKYEKIHNSGNRIKFSEIITSTGIYDNKSAHIDFTSNIELLTDLSEIQKYLPNGHPDKVKNFKPEVGKWYSFNWDYSGKDHIVIAKIKKVEEDYFAVSWRSYLWLDKSYSDSDAYRFKDVSNIKELSIKEIQPYLPIGHPDKITSDVFKKGEYIVLIDKGQSTGSATLLEDFRTFIQNHCYKVRENSTFLKAELDSSESTTNGWVCIPYNPNQFHKTRNWRYATQEEIDEYERRGKPYDVTELQKKELSMKEIQKECKKRFPIGCTYIDTSKNEHVLKEDSCTYRVIDKQIWAHSMGGYLYEDGEWAELVSLPEENVTEIPEYIECTETQESYFIKGNIYKVIDSSSLTSARLVSNINLCEMGAGTQLFCLMESYGKKYWKPSTKEAYEQQKPLTYESVSGCFPTDKKMFIYDEVGQYPLTPSECWKNIPKFEEQKEFDIYGPTPDIE